MDFSLSGEQNMIIKTTRDFVVNELYPHEAEIEATGVLRHDLRDEIKRKAIDAGLYAANMPAEVGGAAPVCASALSSFISQSGANSCANAIA